MFCLDKFTMKDRTEITFYQYGSDSGYPIIVHAGAIGHYKFSPALNELITFFGFTFYVINRPGCCGSGVPKVFSKVLHWSEVVADFIQKKNLNKFGVIGISGGSSYAYSLAYSFPERVEGLWILSGMPDIHLPGVLEVFPKSFTEAILNIQEKTIPELQEETTAELVKLSRNLDLNNASNENKAQTQEYWELLQEQVHNKSLGLVIGQKLLASNWGFSVSDLHRPISLWHSKEDDEIPYEPVDVMLRLLPTVKYFEQKEGSHDPSERTILQMLDDMQLALLN